MWQLVIVIVLLGLFGSAYAQYVGDNNGLYDGDNNHIFFPLVKDHYRLQISINDYDYDNSTINVGYSFKPTENYQTQTGLNIKQLSGFNDSAKFNVEKTIPVVVNFTVSFDLPGTYYYTFSQNSQGPNASYYAQQGGYVVVSGYSKAITKSGNCKDPQMLTTVKYDYSTLVCVSFETHQTLIQRGWAKMNSGSTLMTFSNNSN